MSAIKFLNPNRRVVVSDLQTRNFPESGIVAWKARGFTVKRTQNIGHRQYGILATADSRKISITDNIQVGVVVNNRSGTAGISVADSAKAKAVIKRNVSVGWNLGIFLRESRGGLVQHNTVKGNCGGVLIFDDSNTEKPNQTGTVIGGAWTVKRNSSIANNRLCFAGRDGDLAGLGSGHGGGQRGPREDPPESDQGQQAGAGRRFELPGCRTRHPDGSVPDRWSQPGPRHEGQRHLEPVRQQRSTRHPGWTGHWTRERVQEELLQGE